MEKNRKNVSVMIVLFSLLFIFGGYKLASAHYETVTIPDYESELNDQVFAKVLKIDSVSPNPDDSSTNIVQFTCVITSGPDQNKTVQAVQYSYKNNAAMPPEVSVNDRVVLGKLSSGSSTEWAFENYDRIRQIMILSLVFLALLLFFGGKKGIRTVFSLALTCLALFFVLIPSILAGFNIYLFTILICIFIIAVSFTLTGGANQKSLAAAIGCTGGVVFSGLIYLLMEKIMRLTGFYNDETSRLIQIFSEHPLDLKAVVFAMVTIGALGATMDVAMSIASSLEEIRNGGALRPRYAMIRSGLNIGKDIMGTMTNTLILAYLGSSLVMVVIYAASHYPLLQLLNMEEIVIEILQSLIGSLGMLFTIPFTTLVSAFLLKQDPAGPAARSKTRTGKDFPGPLKEHVPRGDRIARLSSKPRK